MIQIIPKAALIEYLVTPRGEERHVSKLDEQSPRWCCFALECIVVTVCSIEGKQIFPGDGSKFAARSQNRCPIVEALANTRNVHELSVAV